MRDAVICIPTFRRPRSLARLLDAVAAQVRDVAEADRELYHTALAHCANHLVILVSQAMQPVKIGLLGPNRQTRTREWIPSAPIT